MSGGPLQGLENAPAGAADSATGNFTAAGNRFAAAASAPAGAAEAAATPEPVPRVARRPKTVTPAPPWTAPQPPGGGHVTVNRDVLRSVAATMRSELAALEAAVNRVQAAGAGVGSLRGWPTADAFRGNATNAHDGCLDASTQAGNGHRAAAGNLAGSAATYDVAESDSTQAVRGVAAAMGG